MKNTHIEWADHTFNPWEGCEKVSAGCKFCYAEVLNHRWAGKGKGNWGKDSERKFRSEDYWKQPLKWNNQAIKDGIRYRVFCASMADIFEDRTDLVAPRQRFFELIEQTDALIWMLLTKRPENINKLIPNEWFLHGMPDNVWVGATVEEQKEVHRIHHLKWAPCKTKFLSCEPLVGEINFSVTEVTNGVLYTNNLLRHIDWVIAGGESGHHARPMHDEWLMSIKKQCDKAKVPFFFKQWGEWISKEEYLYRHSVTDDTVMIQTPAEFVHTHSIPGTLFHREGKNNAGNFLRGKQYLGLPKSYEREIRHTLTSPHP